MKPSLLPASTIKLFEAGPDGPFPVAWASEWADRVIGLGVETPEIFDVYGLDDSQGHECGRILRHVLASIGAWPEAPLARCAVWRDIALGALLRKEITPEQFSMTAAVLSGNIRSASTLSAARDAKLAQGDMQTLAKVDEVFAFITMYVPCEYEDAHLRSIGVDPADPYPWLVGLLSKNGMIDESGSVIPAVWSPTAES